MQGIDEAYLQAAAGKPANRCAFISKME